MATTNTIPPVPPLPLELAPLARWLELIRNNTTTGGSSSSDYINVKDYGALGNGVTDDYASIQAALTFATTYGGTVFFPAGTYVCNTPLVVDTGTSWSHHGPRANLKGAGSANTRLLCTAASVQFLTIGGFGAQYYINIEGLYFQGPGYVDETGHPAVDGYGTGTAIRVQASSWSRFSDVVVRGWGTAYNITDTFSMLFDGCYVQSNLQGLTLGTTIYAHPNAITFVSCGISDNKNYGVYADLATTLNMTGGSVENNGIGGSGVFVGGVFVSGGTDGAAQVNMSGVYFEGNAGTADVYINNATNPGASSFSGCTFNRIYNTDYVTNNILIGSGVGMINKVSVQGCGFQGFNTYVANAARKYINTTGAGSQASWSGCFFGSALETPTIDNMLTGAPTKDLMRVTFAGGTGPYTPVLPLTSCPSPNAAQWVRFTTDALIAAGVPGVWTLGVPE